ncbi:lysoplasmalogenase family protein [Tepidibacter aestuarii]|uniref:lysoplasmalogenase family protein n=1 Tax=Tepidibacter aestuarii TaxID=2925782 RepID=UPI0020BDDCDA|nr:lysoplasmalogenase family protein [Tepidibacter aestuarii]CAH2213773.1 conserved membrane protein of unknown function [Tepidibacter aestuarii]
MNNIQRVLLSIYLPITIFILILDNLYPGENLVSYIKFSTIITLFLVALRIKKKYYEQKFLNLSIFFIVIADFFLVFCNTIPELSRRVVFYGIIGFMLAYLSLIIAFQKNFKIGSGELLAIVPVLGIFIPIFVKLYPYVPGAMFYGVIIFGLVLCYMVWTSISTLFRGYFTPKISRYVALSGFLMLVCDMGVANELFNPAFAGQFVPWLKNIIWVSYIPAWTLIVYILADDNLLR